MQQKIFGMDALFGCITTRMAQAQELPRVELLVDGDGGEGGVCKVRAAWDAAGGVCGAVRDADAQVGPGERVNGCVCTGRPVQL